MESGDDGLESEANVRPRPCLTGAGSPGAQSTATDRGPSRQARLNRSAEGARTAYSARHTCPKTPETQSRNRSVRQAASGQSLSLGSRASELIRPEGDKIRLQPRNNRSDCNQYRSLRHFTAHLL